MSLTEEQLIRIQKNRRRALDKRTAAIMKERQEKVIRQKQAALRIRLERLERLRREREERSRMTMEDVFRLKKNYNPNWPESPPRRNADGTLDMQGPPGGINDYPTFREYLHKAIGRHNYTLKDFYREKEMDAAIAEAKKKKEKEQFERLIHDDNDDVLIQAAVQLDL